MDTNDHPVNDDGRRSSPIGERIRAERLRLGLSQALFANKVKVHRKTQINYETGERKPDTDYLQAIAKEGVDVGYVLTGESQRDIQQAYSNILDTIKVELSLSKGHQKSWDAAFELVKADLRAFQAEKPDESLGEATIRVLIHQSPLILSDSTELADLLNQVEFVVETDGSTLNPEQKARALVRLFRQRKISGAGYVDLQTVREAIKKSF